MRRWLAGVLILAGSIGLGIGAWDRHAAEAYRARAAALLAAHPEEDLFMDGDWAWDRTELEVAAEARLIGPGATRADYVEPHLSDPVAAIGDFSDRLGAEGIALLVVPVPARPLLYPDALDTRAFRKSAYAGAHHAFLDALRDRNVAVVDLLPPLQAKSYENPSKFVNRLDQHLTGHGVVIAARTVAESVRAQGVTHTPIELTVQWERRTLEEGLGERLGQPRPEMPLRAIRHPDGTPLPVRNPDSPVTVIGDSNLGWYHNLQASFQEQLTAELGYPVDGFVVHGGGATRVRETLVDALADPAYRASRRVVVWLFMEGTARRRNWEITPLELFPPTRLERRQQLDRVATDQRLVHHGESRFELTKQWFPPAKNRADRATWLRGTNGAYHFDAPRDASAGSIILEIMGFTQPKISRTYAIRLNKIPLGSVTTEPRIRSRHRLTVPPGALREGRNTLDFVGTPADLSGSTFTLGLIALTLTQDPATLAVEAPMPPKHRQAILRLSEAPESAVLRWRVRSASDEAREMTLILNGTEVVRDLTVGPAWTEQALPLPPGLLLPGDNQLERMGQGRILWDFVEIDG